MCSRACHTFSKPPQLTEDTMKATLALLPLLASSVFAVPTGSDDPEARSYLNKELIEVTIETTEMSPSPRPCADEYHNRTEEFNLVDPSIVLSGLKRLTPEQYHCVHPSEPRVLLQNQQLSSTFRETPRVNDWCFYNGCVVQSITVPYRATFSTDCSSRSECIVYVPCVVPKMMIRFDYEPCAGGNSTGTAAWWVMTKPIAIRVRISKNDHRSCEIFTEVEKNYRQSNWLAYIDKQDYSDRKQIFSDVLNGSPALQTFIADEINVFTIRVIQEAFSQSNNVFSPIEELHRFCDQLVVPEEPDKPLPPINRVPGESDTPLPPVNITRSASTDEDNHQTTRWTTKSKNDTDTINVTVNVNINMIPPNSISPVPPSFNREMQFWQLLKLLNFTQLSNPPSLEPTNNDFSISH